MTTRRKALQLALGTAASQVVGSRLAHALPAACSGLMQTATPAAVGSPSMAWWEEARFGLFLHWGLYSVAAGEWQGRQVKGAEHFMIYEKIPLKEYATLAKSLTLDHYDPEVWCQAARRAGMKYLVITAKHHEGFAMYDSPSSAYNIVKLTPYGKDPMKLLAAACARNGLKFCFYYSLGRDWEDPDAATNYPTPGGRSNLTDFPDEAHKDVSRYFERKVKPQVRELLTQYGPIGVLWFDTPERISRAESVELRAMIRQLQPGCIVSDRIGNNQGDFEVAEQSLARKEHDRPWESDITMSRNWGYTRSDNVYKSPEVLIRDLIEVVSAGGNFLLDTGPTPQGTFTSDALASLAAIGRWMSLNGEAIHGTTRWAGQVEEPLVSAAPGRAADIAATPAGTAKDAVNDSTSKSIAPDIRFTGKGSEVYVFARSWHQPSIRIASLAVVKGRVLQVALLGVEQAPVWHQDVDALTVKLTDLPQTGVPIYVLRVRLAPAI